MVLLTVLVLGFLSCIGIGIVKSSFQVLVLVLVLLRDISKYWYWYRPLPFQACTHHFRRVKLIRRVTAATVLLSLIKDMASIWLHRKFHELMYKIGFGENKAIKL